MAAKFCQKCHATRPHSAFSPGSGSFGLRNWCFDCEHPRAAKRGPLGALTQPAEATCETCGDGAQGVKLGHWRAPDGRIVQAQWCRECRAAVRAVRGVPEALERLAATIRRAEAVAAVLQE